MVGSPRWAVGSVTACRSPGSEVTRSPRAFQARSNSVHGDNTSEEDTKMTIIRAEG